jgi:Ras family protein T1
MKDHVRILLIGDSGVGKSSLISSYVSRHFPEEVPAVMTDAIIPPDTTANNVCVTIMDSSARPGDREVLKHKIRAADSVIALYDVTRPETFDSLKQGIYLFIYPCFYSSNYLLFFII